MKGTADTRCIDTCHIQVVHGSLGDQEVQAVLLPTNAKLIPSGPMAHCFSLVLGKPGAKRAYSEAAKVVLDRRKWGGTFPAGNVAMFPDIATDPLHRTIFCTNTAHFQGEVPSSFHEMSPSVSTYQHLSQMQLSAQLPFACLLLNAFSYKLSLW